MPKSGDEITEDPFERAKLPMILAAVGVAGGLAIAGSVERTAGGAIVLGAWVLGIGAMHRLGRAGSVRDAAVRSEPPERDRSSDEGSGAD